jgi:hypothetical protein
MKMKETGFDEYGRIERNALDTLRGKTIGAITQKGNYLLFSDKRGKPLFQVQWECLFDGDGNRFQE